MAKNSTVIDLCKLRQHQVAYIIGRSPRWLQSHENLFKRDSAGFYDCRQVFQAMLELARPVPADVSLLW